MITCFKNEFSQILEKIYREKYGFIDDLKYFHKVLNYSCITEYEKENIIKIKELGKDRSSIFYDTYHNFIDSNNEFNDIYYKFINEYVKPFYAIDNKIVIQKTPNIRISFPLLSAIGKRVDEDINNDVIGLHKDSDFGHCEDEINFIIPITDMFDTNSIYYEPFINSNISTENYKNLNLNKNEFFIVKFNKLLHYNKINKTGVTRISLDFRIITYDKYIKCSESFKGTKFELGKYYIIV